MMSTLLSHLYDFPPPSHGRYYTPRLTAQALGSSSMERGYYQCWSGLKSHFTGSKSPAPSQAEEARPLAKSAAA